MEHKEHKNAGLMLNTKGYILCYSGKVKGDYSGVVMFIREVFCPQVIFTDDLRRFLVVQISYEGQVLWLVGVYASNLPQQRSLLWQNLASLLKHGQVGIMMGHFIVCFEEAQSTSMHSIMKISETQSWEQLNGCSTL